MKITLIPMKNYLALTSLRRLSDEPLETKVKTFENSFFSEVKTLTPPHTQTNSNTAELLFTS